MQFLDDAAVGVEGDEDGLSVLFVSLDFIDVDAPSLSVDLDDLSSFLLVLADGDSDFVVLPDGEGSDAVLLSEFLGQSAGHDLSSDRGGGGEVSQSLLSSGGTNLV